MIPEPVLEAILHCDYPGLRLNIIEKGDSTFLQVECVEGSCNVTHDQMNWKGRKWYLSPYATPSEAVQTAFKAILTALEHEARERFTYKGVAVMDPHLDLDNLVQVRSERV